MNYIATSLYTYLKDEDLTFDIFLSILVQKDLKALFINGVPDYHVRHFQLEILLKEHLPDLFYHFRRLQLNIEVITGPWIMTLFCGYFKFDHILPILDNFFDVTVIALINLFLGRLVSHFQNFSVSPEAI
jgi:hypothetical protein